MFRILTSNRDLSCLAPFRQKVRTSLKLQLPKPMQQLHLAQSRKQWEFLLISMNVSPFPVSLRNMSGSCEICLRTKYLQKGPIGYVTPLHVSVRPCSDITIDLLQLSLVFTKWSLLYSNIPVGKARIVCISRVGTIVDRQSGFHFLILIPDNFTVEKCTATFDTHVVPPMGYLYCIVFDRKSVFILSYF